MQNQYQYLSHFGTKLGKKQGLFYKSNKLMYSRLHEAKNTILHSFYGKHVGASPTK